MVKMELAESHFSREWLLASKDEKASRDKESWLIFIEDRREPKKGGGQQEDRISYLISVSVVGSCKLTALKVDYNQEIKKKYNYFFKKIFGFHGYCLTSYTASII